MLYFKNKTFSALQFSPETFVTYTDTLTNVYKSAAHNFAEITFNTLDITVKLIMLCNTLLYSLAKVNLY